ncbi:hypothetical protein BJX96DRAFT_160132 [Aspergillus floccosus]
MGHHGLHPCTWTYRRWHRSTVHSLVLYGHLYHFPLRSPRSLPDHQRYVPYRLVFILLTRYLLVKNRQCFWRVR